MGICAYPDEGARGGGDGIGSYVGGGYDDYDGDVRLVEDELFPQVEMKGKRVC